MEGSWEQRWAMPSGFACSQRLGNMPTLCHLLFQAGSWKMPPPCLPVSPSPSCLSTCPPPTPALQPPPPAPRLPCCSEGLPPPLGPACSPEFTVPILPIVCCLREPSLSRSFLRSCCLHNHRNLGLLNTHHVPATVLKSFMYISLSS